MKHGGQKMFIVLLRVWNETTPFSCVCFGEYVVWIHCWSFYFVYTGTQVHKIKCSVICSNHTFTEADSRKWICFISNSQQSLNYFCPQPHIYGGICQNGGYFVNLLKLILILKIDLQISSISIRLIYIWTYFVV